MRRFLPSTKPAFVKPSRNESALKLLALTVPPTLLARADEVIE
jgi:hypothetical protein